jgi:hypothetical protein
MTYMDSLPSLTSHFEPMVPQGLIYWNFQPTQDALAFLAKYQGLGHNRRKLRLPRRDYDRRNVSRRTQVNPHRDNRVRDRGNIWTWGISRRTDVVGGTIVIRIVKTDETLMDARRREIGTRRSNRTPRFNPRDERPLVGPHWRRPEFNHQKTWFMGEPRRRTWPEIHF